MQLLEVPVSSRLVGYHPYKTSDSGSHSGTSFDIGSIISSESGYHSKISSHSSQSSRSVDSKSTETSSHSTPSEDIVQKTEIN